MSQFSLSKTSILFALSAMALASAISLQAAEADEWVDLLPENKLATHWTTTGNWSISEEGVVSLVPRPGESGWTRYDAYLWLTGDYRDFEFQFEYKLNPKGNSGFYFHVGDVKQPVAKGIEVQIYDSYSPDPQAKLTDHTSGGVIPGVPPQKNAAKPAGEWNHFLIVVKGDLLTVKLNGETVNEVKLNEGRLAERPKSGSIGFQDHGLPLLLRNLKMRKL